jgi:hypothetical protein
MQWRLRRCAGNWRRVGIESGEPPVRIAAGWCGGGFTGAQSLKVVVLVRAIEVA